MPYTTTNAAVIRMLADLLKSCPIEGVVKYEDIARVAGTKHFLVYRAMKVANAEAGAIFVNVRMTGFQRMPHDEAHALGRKARVRGRRIFRRATDAIGNVLVVANDMSNAARIKAFSEQAALGLLTHMTFDRNRPVISEGAASPPTHETVRAGIEAMRAAARPVG